MRQSKTVKVGTKVYEVQLIEREKEGKTRVFVFPEEGSETVLDNFQNRRNRPVQVWRAVANDAMFAAEFTSNTVTGMRWSQKAGCSCGCSPGFISRGTVRNMWGMQSWRGFDVYVTPQPANPKIPANVVLGEN